MADITETVVVENFHDITDDDACEEDYLSNTVYVHTIMDEGDQYVQAGEIAFKIRKMAFEGGVPGFEDNKLVLDVQKLLQTNASYASRGLTNTERRKMKKNETLLTR